jgi:hypothetical protein
MSKIMARLLEADITDRIARDPQRSKQLNIAWKHDKSLPHDIVARLGPKPDERALAKAWSDMLEKVLERTNYGDLSRDMKYADWLTKLYTSGAADWEDISGEGGDALGAWHALSTRSLLTPQDQDLNKFKTLGNLYNRIRRQGSYNDELARIKNATEIAKMKKDAKDVVLVDDDKYWAAIPMNYGACYVFNNSGHISNFCTGGSSGANWFKNYAPNGPIVTVVDKANINDENGKWQFHAPTSQMVNSVQDRRYDREWNDEQFATRFPGLMRKIVTSMAAQDDAIRDMSTQTLGKPYNVASAISQIKDKFPKSYASRAKDEPDTAEPEPEAALTAPTPAQLTIDEDLRPYLSPTFQNTIDPNRTERRVMRVRYGEDGKYETESTTASDAIRQLVNSDVGRTLLPGSIRRVARPRG